MRTISTPSELKRLEQMQNNAYYRKVEAFNARRAAQREEGRLRSQIKSLKRGSINRNTRKTLDRLEGELRRASSKARKLHVIFERADKAHDKALANYNQAKDKRINLSPEKRISIARKAGIPSRYFDRMKFALDSEGTTHIYYGGEGRSDGPGHGHAVVNRSGELAFNRRPGSERRITPKHHAER